MFLSRSPRHWPPAAALFALLIAATFTSGETASAQAPASVPPATPAPASSLPSMPAPSPANGQNTPSPQHAATTDAARRPGGSFNGKRDRQRCPQSQRPINLSNRSRCRISRTRQRQRRWRFRLQYLSHLCPACRLMAPCPKNHRRTLWAPRISRSTASSIRLRFGCIRWAISTTHSSRCVRGPAAACCTCSRRAPTTSPPTATPKPCRSLHISRII